MTTRRWDLFCNVIDNFGDIAVSWRLARQLHVEHGLAVRLWVDDLATFHRLVSNVDATARVQHVDGVEIGHWTPDADLGEPGDVVVDVFGSRAPDAFVERMARKAPPPVWINLEYLSAEDWVEDCHGMQSPHPQLPIVRHFFFPGFTAATGGLIEERDLALDRFSFLRDPAMAAAAWAGWHFDPPAAGTTVVSLFGYGGPSVASMLEAWASGDAPVCGVLPPSRMSRDVLAFFGVDGALPGTRLVRDALEVRTIPFQTQAGYDRLLWLSDCNFVRGEDSFVRAQWAESPFVWQIYPQEGGAHWTKLHSFVSTYGEGLEEDARDAVREFWRLWNRGETSAANLGHAWRRFWSWRDDLRAHDAGWAAHLRTIGNLTENLVRFSAARI